VAGGVDDFTKQRTLRARRSPSAPGNSASSTACFGVAQLSVGADAENAWRADAKLREAKCSHRVAAAEASVAG